MSVTVMYVCTFATTLSATGAMSPMRWNYCIYVVLCVCLHVGFANILLLTRSINENIFYNSLIKTKRIVPCMLYVATLTYKKHVFISMHTFYGIWGMCITTGSATLCQISWDNSDYSSVRVEKYRPQKLDELISHKDILTTSKCLSYCTTVVLNVH